MRSLCVAAALLIVAAVGCAPKATFELTVLNKTNGPVTVGLVKTGPPYEAEWASPEDQALESSVDGMPPWGHVVPPGRALDSPAVTGAFPEGTLAYLRIYRGERRNAELMAISSPSPDRVEVLLFPGRNVVIVTTDASGLHAGRVRQQQTPTTSR
jgi:hypothetical protein